MKKSNMGRPPRTNDGAATKTLGGVRVTEAELESYAHAAKLEGIDKKGDWIRSVLNAAAKRTARKHERVGH